MTTLLKQRAERGSRAHALSILNGAPDVPPSNNDII